MRIVHRVDPDKVPAVSSRRDADHAQGSGLVATGLRHAYGRLTVLDLDRFAVAPGDRHAVIGPNGAGKSTLLGVLAGAITPQTGHVTYNGRDITGQGPAGRARAGIGRTVQHPTVWPDLTCLDCVRVGGWHHRHHPDRTSLEVLDLVGLADHADQPAGALSHGHRRMLDLAVALAGEPRVLLLDEPAAGLTDTDTARLLDILHGLPAWMAVVLVEHHMHVVAAAAGWITVLHHGRRYTDGPADTVRADPHVAALYLGGGGGGDAARA
ncbi:ATP-binding cassette domain-containing protein [Micromonospora sp. WMMD1082]|uniref:ABC transporter ATP-binding protein n=1 Tax=Micromonospora sp. WMMD1082 TaxID=3016104 RepID=UPI002416A69F|nr:ATP-binding cassette domain-containing protein [Micromonospora sp. WMMD1082]MDG4795508.1 ATP-binding cassette domain-containing protein [Micromonospora sp. WMMD1082]